MNSKREYGEYVSEDVVRLPIPILERVREVLVALCDDCEDWKLLTGDTKYQHRADVLSVVAERLHRERRKCPDSCAYVEIEVEDVVGEGDERRIVKEELGRVVTWLSRGSGSNRAESNLPPEWPDDVAWRLVAVGNGAIDLC